MMEGFEISGTTEDSNDDIEIRVFGRLIEDSAREGSVTNLLVELLKIMLNTKFFTLQNFAF